MPAFADGAHVAALATARPARGLIAIRIWDNVPWQASFIATLRNQCLTWGGEANLPIPWNRQTIDNPLFWRIVEAQDPDLVIGSALSWADLKDLVPDLYAKQVDGRRKGLAKAGFTGDVAERHVDKSLLEPLVNSYKLGAPITKALIARGGLLWRDKQVDIEPSLARSPASGLCVDVREFWTEDFTPAGLTVPECSGSWDERLAICSLVGGLSPLAHDDLKNKRKIAIRTPTVAGGHEALRFLHAPPQEPADSPYPFSMTRVGVQWARYGGYQDDRVTVVAGDDPWDFALFYALRRLTSQAYWVPAAWAKDDLALGHVADAVLSHQPDPARKATIVSFSDQSLAKHVAAGLARVANDAPGTWPGGSWADAFGDSSARLFCSNTIGAEQSMGMHGGTTSIISTPIPDPRTREISRLQWMVDVRVRDWAPVQDPALGSALLEDVDYNSSYARAAQGSIAYRAPHWIMGGGVPLEGQVATPRLRLPSLLEQLRRIANESGHDVRSSDKGTYADECAVLLGSQEELRAVLDDYGKFTALRELCFSKEPTRRIQDRALWESRTLKPIFRRLGVGPIADAVRRGLLHRGLVHKCARCAAEAWLETDDLAGPLRCPRCRLGYDASDQYWFGVNKDDPPKWLFRINEMVWQFLDADGDIPVRAVQKVIEPKLRIPAATSFEVEVTRRDKRIVELDFCASRHGRLYICEAKLQDRLDSSAKGEEERLAKLKKAATILRADVVVLATGKAAWRNATLNRARSAFPGEWPLLVPTSGARPVA